MADWFDAAQAQYDNALPLYLDADGEPEDDGQEPCDPIEEES